MSSPSTYRSVVHNLIAVIEKQYGNNLSEDLDGALGSVAEVYRQAKSLVTDEPTPAMFISLAEGGIYAASITNSGLRDVEVFVVDETNNDRDGTLASITHVEGTVFSARVKKLLPSAVQFDAARVMEVAAFDAEPAQAPSM